MPYVDDNNAVGGTSRPVVVLVECDQKVFREMGGSSRFNKQIYGTRAHFNKVPYNGPDGSYFRDWCLDPEKPINMLRILSDHPTFTLPRARKWLASNAYVLSARKALSESMSQSGGSGGSTKLFNKKWSERVRQVVFGPHINTDSIYVKRVFQSWFPNAEFAQHVGENEFDGFLVYETGIWRDAEAVSPQPSKARSDCERLGVVLAMSLEGIGLSAQVARKLRDAGIDEVINLCLTEHDQVKGILGGVEDDYRQVIGRLANIGLKLEMTEEEVLARRGYKLRGD